MKALKQPVWRHWGITLAVATATIIAISAQHLRMATLAPHELHSGDAPGSIIWEPLALPHGGLNFESAEERRLKACCRDRRITATLVDPLPSRGRNVSD